MAKRGRPAKQQTQDQEQDTIAQETKKEQPASNPRGYTVTKPGSQYVVKLGGNVVYTCGTDAQAQKYIELAGGKG